MRDFFIRGLEIFVNIVMVILILCLLGVSVALAVNAVPVESAIAGSPLARVNGPIAGLAVLIAGGISLIVFGGSIYLGLGIYRNTRRAAEALEQLLVA